MKYPAPKPKRKARVILILFFILAFTTIVYGLKKYNGQLRDSIDYLAKNFSPVVTEIRVVADYPMKTNRVKRLISIQPGDPLLYLPASQVAKDLKEIGEIRSVSLTRTFRGMVTIELKLRRALAMVAGNPNRYVDVEGEIYEASIPPTDLDLPVITGIRQQWQTNNGERRELLLTALKLAHEISPILQLRRPRRCPNTIR